MAAVLLYFRHDLWRIAQRLGALAARPAVRSELDARMGWYIILGTIPIGIFGFIFRDQIETGGRDLYLIGSALIALGLVLYVADDVGTRTRTLEQINRTDGDRDRLRPGAGAGPRRVALGRDHQRRPVPRVRPHERGRATRSCSRSPRWCSAGCSSCARSAARTSPASAATILATVVAFIVGYATIAFLLRYLVRHTMLLFVVYRVVLGIVVIALTAGGAIS